MTAAASSRLVEGLRTRRLRQQTLAQTPAAPCTLLPAACRPDATPDCCGRGCAAHAAGWTMQQQTSTAAVERRTTTAAAQRSGTARRLNRRQLGAATPLSPTASWAPRLPLLGAQTAEQVSSPVELPGQVSRSPGSPPRPSPLPRCRSAGRRARVQLPGERGPSPRTNIAAARPPPLPQACLSTMAASGSRALPAPPTDTAEPLLIAVFTPKGGTGSRGVGSGLTGSASCRRRTLHCTLPNPSHPSRLHCSLPQSLSHRKDHVQYHDGCSTGQARPPRDHGRRRSPDEVSAAPGHVSLPAAAPHRAPPCAPAVAPLPQPDHAVGRGQAEERAVDRGRQRRRGERGGGGGQARLGLGGSCSVGLLRRCASPAALLPPNSSLRLALTRPLQPGRGRRRRRLAGAARAAVRPPEAPG